jgi:hypothetical protein
MRWVFAIVLVVVAGSVAAFGIWTFGRDEDGDRELALAYVDVIRNDYPELRSVELEHVDGTIWRARNHWADEEPSCALLDTAKFERVGKQSYEGIERTACPGEVVRRSRSRRRSRRPVGQRRGRSGGRLTRRSRRSRIAPGSKAAGSAPRSSTASARGSAARTVPPSKTPTGGSSAPTPPPDRSWTRRAGS